MVATLPFRFPGAGWPRIWDPQPGRPRLGSAEASCGAECSMSELTNGMTARCCQGDRGAVRGGGAWAAGAGPGRGLYKQAAGRKAERGVGGCWAGGAQAAGPDPGGASERRRGGAEDPIHSLGRSMGRSRVNAF